MRLLLLLIFTSMLFGCAPQRRAIPAGEIPQKPALTQEDEAYGRQVFASLAQQFPLERNERMVLKARNIVDELTKAAGAYDEPWRVYVFHEDRIKNAAATRGNYVFVWSGMMRYAENEDELATVLAHEIGHVIAQHTMPNPAEQVNEILSGVVGEAARYGLASQYPVGGQVAGLAGVLLSQGVRGLIVNPESQRKELEADQVGLFLMADACFSPENAYHFWEKASKDKDFGANSFEFFSSHPSSGRRLDQIKEFLPQAYRRYSECHKESFRQEYSSTSKSRRY